MAEFRKSTARFVLSVNASGIMILIYYVGINSQQKKIKKKMPSKEKVSINKMNQS